MGYIISIHNAPIQQVQTLKINKGEHFQYLGLSGLGGLSVKLLFVTFEMGTDGKSFSEGAGANNHKENAIQMIYAYLM